MSLRKRVLALVVTLVGVFAVSAFVAMLVMVIWPGSFKLTAPLLCPDDLPDAVVVEYSVQTSDGTGTNFTLFCVGDRGEFTEIGTWRPYVLLTAFTAAAIVALIVGLIVKRLVKAATGSRAGPHRPARASSERASSEEAPALTSSPAPEDSGGPLISG